MQAHLAAPAPKDSAAPAARRLDLRSCEEIREEFLSRRYRAGSIELRALSLGVLWIFEALDHPFNKLSTAGKRLSLKDTFRAIYTFAETQAAGVVLASGETAFDRAAHEFVRLIPVAELPAISAAITQILSEGLAGLQEPAGR